MVNIGRILRGRLDPLQTNLTVPIFGIFLVYNENYVLPYLIEVQYV